MVMRSRPPGTYDPLRETERKVEAREEARQDFKEGARETTARPHPEPTLGNQPQPEIRNWIEANDAQLAAKQQALDVKVTAGTLSPHEAIDQYRRFDNELLVKMNAEDARAARGNTEAPQQDASAGITHGRSQGQGIDPRMTEQAGMYYVQSAAMRALNQRIAQTKQPNAEDRAAILAELNQHIERGGAGHEPDKAPDIGRKPDDIER